eukprot:3054643-Rhodomonas_salina.2
MPDVHARVHWSQYTRVHSTCPCEHPTPKYGRRFAQSLCTPTPKVTVPALPKVKPLFQSLNFSQPTLTLPGQSSPGSAAPQGAAGSSGWMKRHCREHVSSMNSCVRRACGISVGVVCVGHTTSQ